LIKLNSKNRSARGMVFSIREIISPDNDLRKAKRKARDKLFNGEFDPGSGRTLAACLTHASRTGFTLST
jgi:hypothetical protein